MASIGVAKDFEGVNSVTKVIVFEDDTDIWQVDDASAPTSGQRRSLGRVG